MQQAVTEGCIDLARRRLMATSTTLVLLSKFMSHTSSAIYRLGQDLALPARQHRKQREFLGREVDALVLPDRLAAEQVDAQIADAQQRRFMAAATPCERLKARQEFEKGKRLDQVVVRAVLQAAHTGRPRRRAPLA